MKNIELKARVRDLEDFAARLKKLKPAKPQVLVQEDVFFRVPVGRLKLRILGKKSGELIYYKRPDRSGPKTCDYTISRTSEPAAMRDLLSAALGVRGVVKKVRLVCLAGQTRIHLDDVAGLGLFMELEVVLRPGQRTATGETIARDLAEKLGLRKRDLVSGAYIDLFEKTSR